MDQATSKDERSLPKRLRIDLCGRVFHRLTVVSPQRKGSNIMWTCRCVCGRSTLTLGAKLKSGQTKSCGCLKNEMVAARNHRHGGAKGHIRPALMSYYSAKRRCTVPGSPGYENYGGAGIKMHDDWLNSPAAFLDYMGPRPAGTSLDRVDNDRGYEPGNCRWATDAQQNQNQRKTVLVTMKGETLALSAFCRKWGLSDGSFYYHYRLKKRPVSEAFALASNPALKGRKRPRNLVNRHLLLEPSPTS